MLPRGNRADKKTLEEVFRVGKFLNSPNLTFKFIQKDNLASKPRISFIVPKAVSKKAVERNMLRRKGYSALAKHFDKFPAGINGVFLFKKPIRTTLELGEEIKTILRNL
jgi:ribonuclease P protein component